MSTYSWTGPSAADVVVSGDISELEEALGVDIMFDGDYHLTADRDYVLVRGLAAIKQSIYHRLITKPGEFRLRPSYGVGVLSYVKKRNRPAELQDLQQRIIDQLSLDPAIDEVLDATVENLEDAPGIRLGLKIRVRSTVLQFRPLTLIDGGTSGLSQL